MLLDRVIGTKRELAPETNTVQLVTKKFPLWMLAGAQDKFVNVMGGATDTVADLVMLPCTAEMVTGTGIGL